MAEIIGSRYRIARAGVYRQRARVGLIMRIAVLGDAHLIADKDPHADLRRVRAMFHRGVPAYRRMIGWLNTLELDAVFSVGDVIDWCSEENVALAVEVLSELRCPWHITPGNHDLEFPMPGIAPDAYQLQGQELCREAAIACWNRHGVMLGDRRFAFDDYDVLLVDSAARAISPTSAAWLQTTIKRPSILLTHVPLDIPAIRTFIRERDQHRNLETYTQSGSPQFFAEHIAGRIAHVVTGHLHFPGTLHEGGTQFHFLDASFARGATAPTVYVIEGVAGDLRVTAMQPPLDANEPGVRS
jgi:3',5'-cyclic AMP phosphodiesterase CpdA